MVHLSFFIRQLACAVPGSLVNDCRRHDFQITGIACLVQEEIDQCPLQTGTLANINRETCTRNLYTQVEVDQIVLLRQLPVR